MGSLGGDITAANINPAGLGFYKTKEFVFSLGATKNNNDFNYRDSLRNNDKGIFRYGIIGVVLGTPNSNRNEKLKNTTFSFSLNQLASYNNRISYKGFNNYSSFSEQYLEELTKDNADTNAALSNYIFGSSLAFRTYLVDTATDAAGKGKPGRSGPGARGHSESPAPADRRRRAVRGRKAASIREGGLVWRHRSGGRALTVR